jgi:hypothetical protein
VSFVNKELFRFLQNCSKLRFQNEYKKVVIALRVVQFWSEIKLVITNLSFPLRGQIALHSVQLPSLMLLAPERQLILIMSKITQSF